MKVVNVTFSVDVEVTLKPERISPSREMCHKLSGANFNMDLKFFMKFQRYRFCFKECSIFFFGFLQLAMFCVFLFYIVINKHQIDEHIGRMKMTNF